MQIEPYVLLVVGFGWTLKCIAGFSDLSLTWLLPCNLLGTDDQEYRLTLSSNPYPLLFSAICYSLPPTIALGLNWQQNCSSACQDDDKGIYRWTAFSRDY